MIRLIAALGLATVVLMPDLLLAQGNDNGRGQSGSPPGQDVRELVQELDPGRARGEAISEAARNRNAGEPTYCPIEEPFTNPDSCQCPPSYTLAVRYGDGEDFQLLYYCTRE